MKLRRKRCTSCRELLDPTIYKCVCGAGCIQHESHPSSGGCYMCLSAAIMGDTKC
jgi:hypothetical protein